MTYLENLQESSGKLQAFLCLRDELRLFPDNPTLQRMFLQLAEYLVDRETYYVSHGVSDVVSRAKEDKTALLDFVRRYPTAFQRHRDDYDVEQCLKRAGFP